MFYIMIFYENNFVYHLKAIQYIFMNIMLTGRGTGRLNPVYPIILRVFVATLLNLIINFES